MSMSKDVSAVLRFAEKAGRMARKLVAEAEKLGLATAAVKRRKRKKDTEAPKKKAPKRAKPGPADAHEES